MRRVVSAFWAINLMAAIIIAGAWFWMYSPYKASVLGFKATPTIRPTPTIVSTTTNTPKSTQTQIPTESLTSTQTLEPTPTSTVTLTPVPFSEGPIVIGQSVQGRPLEVYRFGTGAIERLIVAGIHGGNEYNTVQLVEQLMAYIKLNPETIPAEVSLYILHDLNPDGVARSISFLGRSNANGVDLNRNWPDGWKLDWNRSGCWTTTYVTGGSKPASEPETQALMKFIQSRHFSGLINYHSAALGIFAGGVPPTQASKKMAQALASVSSYKYPPLDTGCEYTGGMVDWTGDQGIPSVDIELTNHIDTDFDMNMKVLAEFLNWRQ